MKVLGVSGFNYSCAIRKPSDRRFHKAEGFSRENVPVFCDLLEAEFKKHIHLHERVFSVDDTGASVDQSRVSQQHH